jgi:hypothetical protein
MANERSKVSLVTDLDAIAKELLPQPMWMVRPQLNRKYPNQRMTMTAEIVDLNTLNLAQMSTFEML